MKRRRKRLIILLGVSIIWLICGLLGIKTFLIIGIISTISLLVLLANSLGKSDADLLASFLHKAIEKTITKKGKIRNLIINSETTITVGFNFWPKVHIDFVLKKNDSLPIIPEPSKLVQLAKKMINNKKDTQIDLSTEEPFQYLDVHFL